MRAMTEAQRDKEIIEGWARVAEDYEPRPLTVKERHQVERAGLIEEQAKRAPFTLGELRNISRSGLIGALMLIANIYALINLLCVLASYHRLNLI